jgi:exosortase/archaeosortase family protein
LGYVGLTDGRGQYYSPFLAQYSIIDLILAGLIYPSKWILTALGYTVFHSSDWIAIQGSKGVRVAFPCLGVEMMIALFSLIVAYPAIKAKKALFIIGGFAGIHLINILRVTGIILTNYYSYELTSPSHTIFNISVYSFIILYFFWWMNKFKTV